MGFFDDAAAAAAEEEDAAEEGMKLGAEATSELFAAVTASASAAALSSDDVGPLTVPLKDAGMNSAALRSLRAVAVAEEDVGADARADVEGLAADDERSDAGKNGLADVRLDNDEGEGVSLALLLLSALLLMVAVADAAAPPDAATFRCCLLLDEVVAVNEEGFSRSEASEGVLIVVAIAAFAPLLLLVVRVDAVGIIVFDLALLKSFVFRK